MAALIKQVALVSTSPAVPPRIVMQVLAALQKQATRDLAGIWDVSATVDPFERLEDVPVGSWPIIISDHLDGNSAGFHRTQNGQPMAMVYATPDINTLSLICSHEMVEMLVDPFGSRFIPGDSPDPNQGRVNFLIEACDPCQASNCGYTVNNLMVSDFYTPNYFDPIKTPGVRYSFTGAINEPRQVLKGCYLSWQDPASLKCFQQLWLGSDAPEIRDLGPQTDGLLSPREFIDRASNAHSYEYFAQGRRVALMASTITAASLDETNVAQANNWHDFIVSKLALSNAYNNNRMATSIRPVPRAPTTV
ncbi:hypothetical protein [Methylobacterium sp. 1030]|uniref:hypothetical protein n=1 Tax=Methylobacterium sp. 1030 TaxID=3156404 RepID=UPI003396FED2